MRNFLFILLSITVLFSCSKDEEIPFIESPTDTIDVAYYHTIHGFYKGILADITFTSDSSFRVDDTVGWTIQVDSLDFNLLEFSRVTNKSTTNANMIPFRLPTGAYMIFDNSSLPDSVGNFIVYQPFPNSNPDLLFNGQWLSESTRMEYFIYYVQEGDTSYQWFEGFRQ